jgi:hypothetical protein
MGLIIQLDGGPNAGVRIEYQKINRQLTDAIEDGSVASAVAKVEHLEQLHLREHDVLGQILHESLEKYALALRQQLSPLLERPEARENGIAPHFLGHKTYDDRGGKQTDEQMPVKRQHAPLYRRAAASLLAPSVQPRAIAGFVKPVGARFMTMRFNRLNLGRNWNRYRIVHRLIHRFWG